MFRYNLGLAIKSLKERPSLTLLTIFAIALGLGLYTTVSTIAYQSGQIPLPHISQQIRLLQMDNREASAEEVEHQARMVDTTYKDTVNLYNMEQQGISQTFNWPSYGILNVEDPNISPMRSFASVTTHEFFDMFEAPFLFGNAWDKTAQDNGEAVIVISKLVNDQLFGGVNSVGKTVRLNTQVLKIIGVLDTWQLSRRFYDRSYSTANPDNFFIPYTYAIENNLPRRAGFDCWEADAAVARSFRTENRDRLLNSECAWITYWAIVTDEKLNEYNDHILRYIDDQKTFGRFPRENKVYLTNLNDQLLYINGRNQFVNVFSMLSTLFFAVCLLNAIGILLAKFMRRTKEVSLRRALGAKKKVIIYQHLIEVIIIGILGGAVGVVISYFGLKGMMKIQLYASDYRLLVEDLAPYYQLDLTMIASAFAIGIFCTLIVSIYPIWRLCNISPATQLKSQ